MRLAVVIPTLGQPAVLGRVLAYLEEQDRLPSEVVVSAPDQTHLPRFETGKYPLSYVFGTRGSSVQRNRGLDAVLERSDVVTFFEDGFLPARSYLDRLASYAEAFHDVVAILGYAVVDGARGAELTFDEGLMALRAAEASSSPDKGLVDHPGTYGCNISIRTSLLGTMRFDERLIICGWEEEMEFTGQLRRSGRVVGVPALLGVRLGLRCGEISGVRSGYSQVVNPTYLIRKGTIPTGFALKFLARNVIANVVKSLWSEPDVDRRGRLKGNLIGAYHLAQGRVEPEYVLKL